MQNSNLRRVGIEQTQAYSLKKRDTQGKVNINGTVFNIKVGTLPSFIGHETGAREKWIYVQYGRTRVYIGEVYADGTRSYDVATMDSLLAPVREWLAAAAEVVAGVSDKRKTMAQTRDPDLHGVRELSLWIDNVSGLEKYRKLIQSNLLRKFRAGKYDAEKAPRLWLYLVEGAAHDYVKTFGGPNPFDKATRVHLATELARKFEQKMEQGEAMEDDGGLGDL